MKVAIIASAFSGNKGAAAMLESSIQHLTDRGGGASFVLLSMYPKADRALNRYRNVRILPATPLRLGVVINGAALVHRLVPPLRNRIESAVPEVRALAGADVLLDEGGITFVDGRGKFLIYNVASVLPALLVGTPVVKVAQALGPFTEPLNRLAARLILPRMAAVVSRGAITLQHLQGLGLTNVHAGADLAFTLVVGEEDQKEAASAIDLSFFADNDVVGFSPSTVLQQQAREGEDYVAEVVRAIDYLTQELGRKVFLVAHSARANSEKTHNNDLPVCREIYARLARPQSVLFVDDELSPEVLRIAIGRCDVFVASRFHAMVSSLATGVPTLVIGWSHKYREVLDMFGQAGFAFSHAEYSDEAFKSRLEELIARKEDIRAEIARALGPVKNKALEQVSLIEAVATQ